ncbi:class II aaRS and biotin synthetase [Gyrodon lividus]|nr:class II aaRS and biotin synthetase [Gyrodon lividus]
MSLQLQSHPGVLHVAFWCSLLHLNIISGVLALGVNAKRTRGLFGLHDTLSSFGSVGVGLARDTSILRIIDKDASLYLSFPSQASVPATVNHDANETAVSRLSSATLDLVAGETHVFGCYTDDKALAGVLTESGLVALWSCTPPLTEQLLVPTLSALGLRFDFPASPEGKRSGLSVLPQLLLAHPEKWEIQQCIVRALFPEQDLETTFSPFSVKGGGHETRPTTSLVFPDEQDTFSFHLIRKVPADDPSSGHPLFCFMTSQTSQNNEKVKDIILPAQPLTTEQEARYTPLFSPSTFFTALDEFRVAGHSDNYIPWGMGDALLYGQVVTSTQTMLDQNPKFLRTLPSPLLSLATKQVAGRGRGKNAWLSPAGCMLMSLKLSVPLKNIGSVTVSNSRSIRASNLVFIQYLYAIAVVEACQALDPTQQWAKKVKLKWPNDIYGEFPGEETWKKSELKKLGGILVNTSFRGGVADVIIGGKGCGLNVLNEPPIGSLAQVVALKGDEKASLNLTVERVAAAILATFERIWEAFLDKESEGFQPFMARYTSAWLHVNQNVTLTTTTPHVTVRIVGITPDYGLLRTEPVGGGQYIDLQPDGNSFDMMNGLIRAKTT